MTRARLVALGLGVGGLLAAVGFAGSGAVLRAFDHVGLPGLIVVAVIHLPAIASMGFAWALLGDEGEGSRWWKFLWARYVRDATAEVLPFSQLGGLFAGVRALGLSGLGTVAVMSSAFGDLLIEQLAKIPYVLGGVSLLLEIRHGAVPSAWIAYAALPMSLLTIFAVVYRRGVLSMLARGAHALTRVWPRLRFPSLDGLRPALERVMAFDRRTLGAFALHLLAWVLGAAETWVGFHFIGVPLDPARALILDSLYCGVRTFGFAVPAALGVQEAAYALLGTLLGIPPAASVAFSLIRRVREVLIGAPGLGAWQVLEGRRALARASRS